MGKAKVTGRAITVMPPESVGGPAFLVVQIVINCTTCGEQEFLIAGHHLRPLLSLFQEFIDAEPELTQEGDVEVVKTRRYTRRWDPNARDN